MKIATLCFPFFLLMANSVETRNLFQIQNQEPPPEILNNNIKVEYNSEDEHEDLLENVNGNESKDVEDTNPAGFVGLTEIEINAMNNYEGDEMIISEENKKRGVGIDITLWPRVNGKLEIPYVIASNITNKMGIQYYIGVMNNHLRKCNSDSSDVWVERDNQLHYVTFVNLGGCYSHVGYLRQAGQPISLTEYGTKSATVLHEMLHTMGFAHEQSRSDRDQYVKIITDNIALGMEENFNKLIEMRPESATPYDYGSVLHYPATAFSKNGQATIVTKDPNVTIGQRDVMSPTDITEVNNVYKCEQRLHQRLHH